MSSDRALLPDPDSEINAARPSTFTRSRRTSATSDRNRALDGLRGAAILLVVAGHTNVPIAKTGGEAGVTLFFVLSGYLITTLLLKERSGAGSIHLGHFYARRALRLLPALIVCLVVTGSLAVAFGFNGRDTAFAGGATLFYFGNFWPIAGFTLEPFGVSWSLAMEEQFYLLWPIMLIFLLRLPRRLSLGITLLLAAASLALRFSEPLTLAGYERAYYLPQNNAWALLAGCALAMWLSGRVAPALTAWRTVAACVVIVLAASVPGLRYGLHGKATSSSFLTQLTVGPVVAACSLILLLAAVTGGARFFRWRLLVWFGYISYGLYLWHGFLDHVIGAKYGSTGLRGFEVGVTVTVPLAIIIAALSRRYIEAPFLRWKSQLEVRWREGSATYRVDARG